MDAHGHIIEMDDEKDEVGGSKVIVFDKELFNEEHLPCSDSSDDENDNEEKVLSDRLNKI